MLIYRRTSLFDSTAQTLVNTVNCVGVMGKGIAKEFKEREPEMFKIYKRLCDEGKLEPGKLWLWRGTNNFVLNFPTKKHWRNPSRLEWIEMGLAKFARFYEQMGIREISFPRLGCGNGGLDWDDVRPMMEHFLSPLKLQIYIHDYEVEIGLPEHLEHTSQILDSEFPNIRTFDEFYDALKRAVEISEKRFVDVKYGTPISAEFIDEGVLKIDTPDGKTSFEIDDLRGVWFSLQQGLLTQEKAGWTTIQGGRPLISMLSALPNVRPIEIQRASQDKSELALELDVTSLRKAKSVEPSQTELSWH